jgi:hypothetical protein
MSWCNKTGTIDRVCVTLDRESICDETSVSQLIDKMRADAYCQGNATSGVVLVPLDLCFSFSLENRGGSACMTVVGGVFSS